MISRRPLAALAALLVAAPLHAQRPATAAPALQQLLSARLAKRLDSLAAAGPGIVGVAVEDLTTGERFQVNERVAFPTASTIKVPLLLELWRESAAGTLDLAERVTLRASMRAGGDGVAQYFSDGGSALAVRDLAMLVSTHSDNMATNILIDRIGMARVNALLDTLGLAEIRLRRPMIRPAESAKGNENVATPRAALALMTRLARCELPMPRAACEDVRRLLELPKEGTLRDVIPESVPAAWKPGTLDGVSAAWGIVRVSGRPYALAVMTSYAGARADDVARGVIRAVHEHFTTLANTTAYGVQVSGELLGPVDSLGVRRTP